MKTSAGIGAETLLGLERLRERYELDREQSDRLLRLLTLIVGDESAPTAVRDPLRVVDVHIADSLVGLEVAPLRDAVSIVDLGSGAGLPGLPLAIALPQARLSLLESQSRKCEFLYRAVSEVDAGNVSVINARAEQWQAGIGGQDAALARALAPQAVVAEYAAPLLRLGGVFVDWRGRREAEDEQRAAIAAAQLGLELQEIRRVEPFDGARDRHLHIYVKVRATPDRFPRRPGIARKRPLGTPHAPTAGPLPAADGDRR